MFNARFGGIFHPKTLCTYFGFSDVQDLDNNYAPLNPIDNEYPDPLDGCAFCRCYGEFSACDSCGTVGCCGCGDVPMQCQSCFVICCAECAERVVNPVLICFAENCSSTDTCRECRVRAFADGTGNDNCKECRDLAFDGLLLGFRNQQEEISQQQSFIDHLCMENHKLRSGD